MITGKKLLIRLTLIGALAFIVFVNIVILGANYIIGEVEKEQKTYEKFVGKQVVIQNDTLTVVNYSAIKEEYTLSDGTEVSRIIVENQFEK